MEEIEIEPRFIFLFSCLIVGPSGCGKTYFPNNELENCKTVMNVIPDNIVWIYTSFQPLYSEPQKTIKNIQFLKGLPKSFENEIIFPPNKRHLIIIVNAIFQTSDPPEVVKLLHSISIIEI